MDAVVLAVLLLWVVFFAITLRFARVGGRTASVAVWLGVTAVIIAIEFVAAFVVLYAILFSLGREATMIALIVAVAIFTLTPAATMYGLGHWHARRAAHE